MLVSDVLRAKGDGVISVSPDQAIWAVLRKFQINQVGALVVTNDDGELLGVLSERDLVNGLLTAGRHLLDLSVKEVMSTEVPTCAPTDSVAEVMQTMTECRTRHLPVLENEWLRGLISIGDVVKARLDDAALENRVLRDISRAHR